MYNSYIFKLSGILFLSIALTESGIAWAFEECSETHNHEDHGLSSDDQSDHHDHLVSDGQSVQDNCDFPRHDQVRIHCLNTSEQIGPTELASAVQLDDTHSSVPVEQVSFTGHDVKTQAKDLWLRAPFDWIPLSSILGNLSLHLFLAVLVI